MNRWANWLSQRSEVVQVPKIDLGNFCGNRRSASEPDPKTFPARTEGLPDMSCALEGIIEWTFKSSMAHFTVT